MSVTLKLVIKHLPSGEMKVTPAVSNEKSLYCQCEVNFAKVAAIAVMESAQLYKPQPETKRNVH